MRVIKKPAVGRPRIAKKAMSPAERKRRSMETRAEAGWSHLTLALDERETSALESGMEKRGITVKRDYVASLILKNR